MNYIKKMLQDCCPNGVEWKELGEVCEIETGKLNANAAVENGVYPFFTTAREISWINSFRWDAEALLIAGNANVGDVKYYSGKFEAYQRTYVLTNFTNSINVRYLFHYVKYQLKAHLERNTKKAAMSYIVLSTLKSFSIPIPPLEIQQEIVQILDKFTEYVTELTAELTDRQKQYSFYRDKLLSFEDEVYQVEWKTLGEILIKGRGTKVTAGQMKELHKDGAPIRIFAGGKTFADVDYGDIPEKDVHHEEAIIVKSRGIIDFEYYTKPFSFKNEFWSYSSDSDDVNLRYVYHYLNHNKSHFQHIAGNMQMPQISSNDTEKYKIPLPTKTVQSRIVQVLDNFDTVCNDLKIGLPKEIELRQKQYEYFREKLLTFTAEGVYPGQWTVDSGQ
ncbi:restriction endonuclease subunit S [Streptococcus suis]|uniref:restriction endonuclease subunit S n=1 Tax=Streptococcus suis TaxID=1307 RepID=UPI001ABDB0EE|nr:restriction endonuclease subunit S [Streptococcus suis]